MNKEKIIELVKTLNNNNYKDVFGAILIFEKLDYLQDLQDIDDKDIEYLEEVYNKFMDSPTITGLLNDELKEIIEEEEEDYKMIFDIEKFNDLMQESDILALEYLEPFIPKDLVDKYNAITQLNYTLTLFESGLLKGSIYDIYIDNRADLFRELGLVSIVTGNGNEYMQSKVILESEDKQ